MDYPAEITLTTTNVATFPTFEALLREGKLIPDCYGRVRYRHGAPVGKLILVRVNKDGTPKYRESAAEWFDPESPFAKAFTWPTLE